MGEIETFEEQVAALDSAMADAGAVTAEFSGELDRMRTTLDQTGRDVETLSRGMSRGLRSAFDGVIFDGMRASDALRSVARSLVDTFYSAAINPLANQFGGMLARGVAGAFGGAFGDGATFSQGRVTPFASGGVVTGATAFAMRGGWGLMGEAGPEAIMPLARGADGRLGVRAEAERRPISIVMNISTPDAQSFQRSQNQIAAQLSRALSRGRRNH